MMDTTGGRMRWWREEGEVERRRGAVNRGPTKTKSGDLALLPKCSNLMLFQSTNHLHNLRHLCFSEPFGGLVSILSYFKLYLLRRLHKSLI